MTIHFGQKTVKLHKDGKGFKQEVIRGYYLVCNDKQGLENRHFLGSDIGYAKYHLDQVADKYLGDFNQYQYWIDYCIGYDVEGKLAWANLDQTCYFV